MLMVFAVCAARSEAQLAKSAPIGYGDRPQKGSIKLDLQVDEDSSVYTKTVMVKLEKLDAAEVEPFVKKSLSKYGSVSVNSQANNLVITDIEPKLSDLVAFVKDMDSLGIENFVQLETEVIKLNNVQASSLVNILKERLSGEGTLESDDSLNVLVVTDVRGKIDYVKDIIEKLDMPPEQIIIEAKIVEVSDTDFSDVGIDLTALLDAGNLALGTSKSSNKQLEYQEPVTQSNRYKNSLINGTSSLDEVINTLVGTGKAKLLANPRIVTLNNKSGSISIQSDMQPMDHPEILMMMKVGASGISPTCRSLQHHISGREV
jgi:type II secretory pathway component GspD/PulD (secretin)